MLLLVSLPPSYIVVPIRKLANIQFYLISAIQLNNSIPLFSSAKEMDINSNNITRGRSDLPNKLSFRCSSVSSSSFSILYYKYMEIDNNRLEYEDRKPINYSQVFYEDRTNGSISVSGVANNFFTVRRQYFLNEALAPKSSSLS